MAGTTMTATIVGVDKASPVLDKVGGKAGETGSKFASAAKLAAGALAGISVVGFFKDSISAFTEAQEQTQKLEDAFDKFPKLGDTTAAAIERISSALETKTKYDDDATNAAAATLAQFNLTGKQIEQLIPLVQDYATATGKDLNTAATDLGKAFLGQTRALKDVGINYKSTGDEAKDFTNITALLQQKVGGFAENEGKTAAGQLAILKNEFGEIQEQIGSAVVPILVELGKIAIPVITDIAQGAGEVVKIIDGLPGPLKAGLIAFAGYVALSKLEAFGKLTAGIKAFKVGLAEAKVEAAAAGQSLTTMGAAGQIAKEKISGIGKALAGPALIAGVAALASEITSAFQNWDERASAVKSQIDTLAQAIVDGNGKISDSTRQQVQESVKSSDVFQALVNNGADYVDTLNAMSGGTFTSKDSTDKFAAALSKLPPAMMQQAIQMTKSGELAAQYASKIQKSVDAHEALTGAADGAAASMAGGAAAFRQAEAASTDALGAFGGMGKAMAVDGVNAHALKKSFDPLNPAIVAMHTQSEIAAIKAKTFAAKLGELSTSLYDDTGKARDLSSATNALRQAMDRAAGLTPTLTDATRDWKQALADAATKALDANKQTQMLGKTVLDAKGNFNLSTQAGRDLSITMEGMGANAAALAAAAGEAAGKTGGVKAASDAAAASLKQSKQDFLDNAKAMGLTADQAKMLAAKYFAIPKNITTTVDVQYQQALADLNKLTGRTLVIPARVQLSSSGVGMVVNGALADGGPALAGKSYLVGEQGPEIMTMMPDGSGFVTSSGPSKRVLAGQYSGGYIAPPSAYGSAATTVIVQVQGLAVGTSREVADHLARPVTEAIARQRRAGVMV